MIRVERLGVENRWGILEIVLFGIVRFEWYIILCFYLVFFLYRVVDGEKKEVFGVYLKF